MPPKTAKPVEIVKERVMLVEGLDAFHCWRHACLAYSKQEIQMIDFGGTGNLRSFLQAFRLLPNYELIRSLVIARDAETDVNAAITSIKASMAAAELSVPSIPFVFEEGTPRTAFMLFPGFETDAAGDSVLMNGTLEDLCLKTVQGDPIIECTEGYLQCVAAKGEMIRHPHKSMLHAFLAGKSRYTTMKLGEAAQAGAWDWNHIAFEPYRQIIASM